MTSGADSCSLASSTGLATSLSLPPLPGFNTSMAADPGLMMAPGMMMPGGECPPIRGCYRGHVIHILTNYRLDEHEARAPGRDLTLAEDSPEVTEQQVTLPALQSEVRPEILASQE